MPRYVYRCNTCEEEFTVIHSINERLQKCQICEEVGSLKKVYTTIRKTTNKKKQQSKIGTVVNKYIEDTKKEVNEEKKRLKNEEFKS